VGGVSWNIHMDCIIKKDKIVLVVPPFSSSVPPTPFFLEQPLMDTATHAYITTDTGQVLSLVHSYLTVDSFKNRISLLQSKGACTGELRKADLMDSLQ